MYSSALSQTSLEKTGESETGAWNSEGERHPQMHSVNNVLTTSQTLAVVPLTSEVVDTLPETERYASRTRIKSCCRLYMDVVIKFSVQIEIVVEKKSVLHVLLCPISVTFIMKLCLADQ